MCTKKKLSERNEEGMAPCKYCKRHYKELVYPKIVEISGEELYYAQCPKCHNHHWDIYEFLGPNIRGTIANWNETMEGKG